MSRKKLLLVGFIIVILIAIPITIFLVKQQQETRSKAAPSTTISLLPSSTAQTPLQKNNGDTVNLDVVVNPGTNVLTFVRLEILYPPDKLATGPATPRETAFAEVPGVRSLLEGPVYSNGKILVTLSVGADPFKVIQATSDKPTTKIATLTFRTIDGTGDTPTEVTFGSTTQALNGRPPEGAGENVLSTTNSSFIQVAGPVTNTTTSTPTPTTSQTTSITPSVTSTLTPTIAAQGTPIPTATASPTVTIAAGTSTPNTAPVCSALNVNPSTTGAAPFSITFTASGTDADGTISKVTFSYGDGQVDNITQGGGIGNNSVNAAAAHTYQSAGSYTASAVLTDNKGGVSGSNCTQAITVTASSGSSGSSQPAPTKAVASLPATGPGNTILTAGGIVGILTAIGAALFFVL